MTQDPAEDPCFPQEVALVVPPPLVGVEAQLGHLNSQEPLLVGVATSLIFQRAGRISHPDKTLQEARLLLYPAHLDPTRASSLVAGFLRHSLEDPGPARLLDLHLLVFHQGGTEDSLHLLLLLPQTAADLPYHPLLEGGLHFPTTDPHLHLWVVIAHLCPAMCPLLLPPSTPSLPPRSLPPPPPLVPQSVGVRPLSRRADRAPLLSRPPRLEGTTTAPLVCPKGTCHSTAMVRLRHMVGWDLSLLHPTRDRRLLEGTSRPHAPGPFLPFLPQVVAWVGAV